MAAMAAQMNVDEVTNGHHPQQEHIRSTAADVATYLSEALKLTLGATEEELERDNGPLSLSEAASTIDRFQSFLSGSRAAFYAQKLQNGGQEQALSILTTFSFSFNLNLSAHSLSAVAFIKKPSPVDPALPITQQLQIINLPDLRRLRNTSSRSQDDTSHYGVLHSVVSSALMPYFDAVSQSLEQDATASTRGEGDQRAGVPDTKKKLAELELSLFQLQQNVEIPQVTLLLHPEIQNALQRALSTGTPASFDTIPREVRADSDFLNSLQSIVNGWAKTIRATATTSRDARKGTAAQEINFWLDMEDVLNDIGAKLQSDGVQLTVEVLRRSGRAVVAASISQDTTLKDASALVQEYNQLMRGFPLRDLLSAISLEGVCVGLDSIFEHVNRIFPRNPYPIRRAIYLLEAISSDLDDRVRSLLKGGKLVHMDTDAFNSIMTSTKAIWTSWAKNVRGFDLAGRAHREKFKEEGNFYLKIAARHVRTRERLDYVASFRNNHEQLLQTITDVLAGSGQLYDKTEQSQDTLVVGELSSFDAVKDIIHAYASIGEIDVLDVSVEGNRAWQDVETQYNERIARVENAIIAVLRDRLDLARSADEMFQVCSRFNALFIRPKIRGAVTEYQTRLLDRVKQDISVLEERYKQRYAQSQSSVMAQLHDLPPVSGAIIWARTIERQLDNYLRKVEDVLGSDWDKHVSGRTLLEDANRFRVQLDTMPMFRAWEDDILHRNLSVNGRLFSITKVRGTESDLQVSVNFDPRIITLFKEVRNLRSLDFSVRNQISKVSADARAVYSYAVTLVETLRIYEQVNWNIQSTQGSSVLLDKHHSLVLSYLQDALPLRWTSFANADGLRMTNSRGDLLHDKLILAFSDAILTLQRKTAVVKSCHVLINEAMARLRSCTYSAQSFQEELFVIQSCVDKLVAEDLPEITRFTTQLNANIQSILLDRLHEALNLWSMAFEAGDLPKVEDLVDISLTIWKGNDEANLVSTTMPLLHEIRLQNQLIFVEPPLETAHITLLEHMHEVIAIVCDRSIIRSSTLATATSGALAAKTFRTVLDLCSAQLQSLYDLVNKKMSEVYEYVSTWLHFQSLWNLQTENVANTLGDDLQKWIQLHQEMRTARSTFETSDSMKHFGLISVSFEHVLNKVNARYDVLQNDLLKQFVSKVGTRTSDALAAIEQARKELEGSSLDVASTLRAVKFITIVQVAKQRAASWSDEVETLRQGHTMLSRQRFPLNKHWVHIEQVEHEYTAFVELLERQTQAVGNQSASLRTKFEAEDQIVAQRTQELLAQWINEKPIAGSIDPEHATTVLGTFQSRSRALATEAELLWQAKEALGLSSRKSQDLKALQDEIIDLQSVWAALSTVWAGLNDLRETSWTNVQPRKLRQALEKLLQMVKEMPSRMRQYQAFDYLQNHINQLIKVNSIVSDLRGEAIRDRHWQKISKQLKPNQRFSPRSMTLADVWDLQLTTTEKILRDVIVQAQGEMGLEEFLRQIKETWQNYALELVAYQNKCRLIRGWDELLSKCSDNVNALQAMRHSPYYKEFEEDASAWEEKLNRVHVVFDIWLEVQRHWVYLEAVFNGNADIGHLLPVESSRFQGVNAEFFGLMKKVQRAPLVLDVLNIAGVQQSLERLSDLLGKIQKALGDYLERERASFPRFYFIGDEDLLEIIGNSKDMTRVAKHLRKMFPGISGLVIGEDNAVLGLKSPQGEEMLFADQILAGSGMRVNEWLRSLERNMQETLARVLADAVGDFNEFIEQLRSREGDIMAYLNRYPTQIAVLAGQVWWTSSVDDALRHAGASLQEIHDIHASILRLLAQQLGGNLNIQLRRKCENLITEFVYQRDVIEKLIANKVSSAEHHLWLLQMRYVYTSSGNHIDRLRVEMANASFSYGFEYLGVTDRLVRTPLTDSCFLALTQALSQRMGGSPYGPAGTGKTETVKALGLQLGRFVLVFNCDDTFDFQAMGRIFLGICQVGAWGCFDEFNRLQESILSAVSQQIQDIQVGLKQALTDPQTQIELTGRQLKINANTGLFITMNPGYAGRSNLPDNLKKLFRSVAMSKPDKELIAEVTLYSQGFDQARSLSRQIVPFFEACSKRMSNQAHYDFGLRALKSVLVSSGVLKRKKALSADAAHDLETQLILQSLHETISPKLIKGDVVQLSSIEKEAFPETAHIPAALEELKQALKKEAASQGLVSHGDWVTKAIQLYQIQQVSHGIMVVGQSGCGKSCVWRSLLRALQTVDGIEGVYHVIEPKVMTKDALYGNLDPTTREWTDGLFTSILRKIHDSMRGESHKRHWIVFDGDVDPEWVENLNSVLDDNKLLTLPNGERLVLPPNVRIIFEVETLRFATPATVSRCGMVWFDDDLISVNMLLRFNVDKLRSLNFDDMDDDSGYESGETGGGVDLQASGADIILGKLDMIEQALSAAKSLDHIMSFTCQRAISSLFGLLIKSCRDLVRYTHSSDFALLPSQIESFVSKRLLIAITWSFAGDCPLLQRQAFGNSLAGIAAIDIPALAPENSIIDYNVTLPDGDWRAWQSQVPSIDIDTQAITQTDVVIPTLDTIRHEDLLYSWLAEHKPLILCGPPGSGKTMTLFNALRKLPNMEVVGLNFSSATSPELMLKSMEQHCEYRKTLNGIVMAPRQMGTWLVMFCDEINLPAPDKYGTQHVIALMRQLIEHNGFWRSSDKSWITLERVQFVGACNPPTDVGRHPLSLRFMRHAPLVMVDYPGRISLRQIYGTFNSAALKVVPTVRGYASAVTEAMIDLYLESQSRFTAAIQPHYIYSPRELTRWVKGIYETIKNLESVDIDGLVRIWAHEALRLFQDRLVYEEERVWTLSTIKRIATTHFPNIDPEKSLGGPILFSNWLSRNYVPVDRAQLREFVKARFRTFCEEEVDVQLILYDDALDHILRIDRVFRQPQGHVILIGVSGSGKTTLSRFVAWMNGLKTFQLKVYRKYTAEDFDEDVRSVLRRCGTKGEKICFIMDESNVLDSAFLERLNTLLANAEVPGLFEGDEFAALMTACREGAQRQGLLLDSQEELYRWFTQQIVKNLHVVFTMNPPEGGLASRAATSPALFNRCVLNWLGDWTQESLFQVGTELTQSMDLDRNDYVAPEFVPIVYQDLSIPPSHREAVVNAMVYVHHSIYSVNDRLLKQQGRRAYVTPRHFLDFVAQYIKLYDQKREDLEEQQRHLNVGLDKLKETVAEVRELRRSLSASKSQLEAKDAQANDKLQRMIVDQRKAESTKTTALEIAKALAKQNEEIQERSRVVQADLARAEPAVLEAQKSVQNIKRQHLTELRSMPTPPGPVKLALEAVCTLLGHKVDNWKAIQAIIRRDDFIASIVMYDNESKMTPTHRAKMQNEYLSLEDFTYERVNRASKACGPLVQWVEAQVEYSEILTSVEPLRAAVRHLEDQKLDTEAQNIAISRKVTQLEENIIAYKNEYAILVSETQNIKSEMTRLQRKVDRSLQLLESLSSERRRWEEGSKGFEAQIDTLLGDTLIAAAFLAYAGLYDQQYRKSMLDDWTQHLLAANIKQKAYTAIPEYLSTPDERVQWQQHSLPVDDLCTENAIILKDSNRYPLIIDPTGRIVEFLQQEHRGRQFTVTSFLDDNFTKQLESALRFGGAILIQDAEHLDPVLNPVLNREYQKTGGRVLIQLGKQEIDFSGNFKLYLSTRDSSVNFSPDICSRTNFVNFTVTQSSLQSQSLDATLKSERSDVYERRANLVKIQGEFAVQVRRLERRLLDALNATQGNILDNDALIDTLETVKLEVGSITAKAAEAEGVMTEVERMMSEYQVIAEACSAIFAVLEHLKYVNHFYQYSLKYFLDIFEGVLLEVRESPGTCDGSRSKIDRIVNAVFVATFRRTSIGILQDDKVTLALLLAQAAPRGFDRSLLDALLDNDLPLQDGTALDTQARTRMIETALSHSVFRATTQELSVSDVSENVFATTRVDGAIMSSENSSSLQSVVLAKTMRADKLIPTTKAFICNMFGTSFFDTTLDLSSLVDSTSPSTPIALCCSPAFDASFRVDNLVASRAIRCLSIAMGSPEALTSASSAITTAALSGHWVFLKNVHLTIPYLQGLEKRLLSLRPHPDFRLWLSMEITPKIPVNLLRISAVVMCEQPAGIRASMKDSLSTCSDRAQAPPAERARLYLLLAFTHAFISERLRYAPNLGWTKKWEFSNADFTFAANVVDIWIERCVGNSGRTNIDPGLLPWAMLRALVVNTYSGKIDDEGDLRRLQRLVDAVVRVETYEVGFDVVGAVAAVDGDDRSGDAQVQQLVLPEAPGFKQLAAWVDGLPERESPQVLALKGDAEKVLLIEAARRMLKNVKVVVDKLEEGEMLNL